MMARPIYDAPGKNEERASWAEEAFTVFRGRVMPNEDDQTAFIDFLADLLHLADRLGLPREAMLAAGLASYTADVTPGEIGSDRPVRRRV